jgi:serine/threonine-protein kinase
VLLKSLGAGAMGDVQLARPCDPARGIPTPIVIKRLHGELAEKKGFVARFKHEAEIAVSVESLHVAKVFDVGSVGETLYIAMEYVDGWALTKVLDSILKSGHHASIAAVVDSIANGLAGLHALHTARDKMGKPLGIVHRDISPKNLMIGEDGMMRLIDLGLGKSRAQDWKTATGVVMGSVGYMPPEQATGDDVDGRADIYAMGVVAFELLTLRNYIKRGPVTQMMEQTIVPKFQNPSEFRPDVPAGLDAVIEKAVKPFREDRFQTPREFLDALRAVVPAKKTAGGMAELVRELFGDSRIERDREMQQLLALPLPDEDPADLEPTKIFVQRDGVAMPDIRYLNPTRVVVRGAAIDGPSVSPRVATELYRSGEDSGGPSDAGFVRSTVPRRPLVGHSALGMSNVPSQVPSTVPVDTGARAFVTQPIPVRRTGVSWTVLISAVVVAAVLGGLAAVGLTGMLRGDEPLATTPIATGVPAVDSAPAKSVVRVEEAHATAPKPIARAEAALDDEPRAVPASKRRHTDAHAATNASSPATKGSEVEPTAPVPEREAKTPVKRELTQQAIKARMEALSGRIEALLKQRPELNQQLLGLKSRIAMNRGSSDFVLVDRELTKLENELRDLGG